MIYVNLKRLYHLQGKLSDVEFSKKLGISRSQLWRIKTRHASVGSSFLEKFILAYPEETPNEYFFCSGRATNNTEARSSNGGGNCEKGKNKTGYS